MGKPTRAASSPRRLLPALLPAHLPWATSQASASQGSALSHSRPGTGAPQGLPASSGLEVGLPPGSPDLCVLETLHLNLSKTVTARGLCLCAARRCAGYHPAPPRAPPDVAPGTPHTPAPHYTPALPFSALLIHLRPSSRTRSPTPTSPRKGALGPPLYTRGPPAPATLTSNTTSLLTTRRRYSSSANRRPPAKPGPAPAFAREVFLGCSRAHCLRAGGCLHAPAALSPWAPLTCSEGSSIQAWTPGTGLSLTVPSAPLGLVTALP